MAMSIRRSILASVLALCLACAAFAQPVITAPTAFDPPVTDKSALEALIHPLPQARVADYLDRRGDPVVYDAYAGKNEDLAAAYQAEGKTDIAAIGMDLGLSGTDLFASVFAEGDRNVFVGELVSVDALALRAVLDLSALAPDDEVWVVDPTGPRAFGPYRAADAPHGCWTPTVEGDAIVFVAKSAAADPPQLLVRGASHFFKQFDVALPCNINIACETSPTIQTLSTGVGFMVWANGGYDQALCSGTLINNPDTPEREPYFMTANHCIAEQAEADTIEVIWDYRAAACDSNETPSLASLPRSDDATLLSTNNLLDMTLLRLGDVPPGGKRPRLRGLYHPSPHRRRADVRHASPAGLAHAHQLRDHPHPRRRLLPLGTTDRRHVDRGRHGRGQLRLRPVHQRGRVPLLRGLSQQRPGPFLHRHDPELRQLLQLPPLLLPGRRMARGDQSP